MARVRECTAGLLLAAGLFGCQARQMVNQYASFDAVVTDLYDKHVLYNLARREAGRTMVQMEYKGFSANLNTSTSMSGKVQFFTNPQDAASSNGASISLNAFQQAFEPNLSNSTTSGLAINSASGRAAGDPGAVRGAGQPARGRADLPADDAHDGGDAVLLLGEDGARGVVLRARGKAAGVQRVRAPGVVL